MWATMLSSTVAPRKGKAGRRSRAQPNRATSHAVKAARPERIGCAPSETTEKTRSTDAATRKMRDANTPLGLSVASEIALGAVSRLISLRMAEMRSALTKKTRKAPIPPAIANSKASERRKTKQNATELDNVTNTASSMMVIFRRREESHASPVGSTGGELRPTGSPWRESRKSPSVFEGTRVQLPKSMDEPHALLIDVTERQNSLSRPIIANDWKRGAKAGFTGVMLFGLRLGPETATEPNRN